jgi:murein DD-endopeptidase MepM/ murein hydrolase activator NlpD
MSGVGGIGGAAAGGRVDRAGETDPVGEAMASSNEVIAEAGRAASRWPSAMEVFARLQAAEGKGAAVWGIFDGAGALEREVAALGGDGSISADDLVALVVEAKDYGRITASERKVLEDLYDGRSVPMHPMARDALGIFLGKISVEGARAEAAKDAETLAGVVAAENAATYASGDLKGFSSKELKEAFPVDMSKGKSRLTSSFGAMDAPRAQGAHKGIDLGAAVGTPLRFLQDGKITWASREDTSLPKQKRGYGNSLYIEFPDGHVEVYAHLNKEAIDKLIGPDFKGGTLKTPVEVKAGQLVPGGTGNSGNTTGPHFHWEVRTGKPPTAVNPLWWLKHGKGNAHPE